MRFLVKVDPLDSAFKGEEVVSSGFLKTKRPDLLEFVGGLEESPLSVANVEDNGETPSKKLSPHGGEKVGLDSAS